MDKLEARLNQPLLERIISLLPGDLPMYLVGGTVRDLLLKRKGYDLDFVTGGNAIKIARRLADDLGAAFYPLDAERNVARVVMKPEESLAGGTQHPARVDISAFQGRNLQEDLEKRDFTINAMALEIHSLDKLIDPLGGAADLLAKQLKACSLTSLRSDPVRVLRAVRFSVNLGLKISPDTIRWMRDGVRYLTEISPERIRDELFRILGGFHPGPSIRLLDNLGACEVVLPELCELKGVQQSSPHILEAWEHSLAVLDRLEEVLDILDVEYHPDKADNLLMGMMTMKLGRYRQQISEHLSNTLNPDRSQRGLLFLAGLFHDAGKRSTQVIESDGKIRFLNHEQVSTCLMRGRGEALRLSNLEIEHLATIVNHHMRPSLLSHEPNTPGRKAVYRFFRDTGAAGVDICLLSLADVLATYGPTLPPERWSRHLELVRSLFEAWWEGKEERIAPPALVDGDELMAELNLAPGPQIGYLLEAIREAQIERKVMSKPEAIALASQLVRDDIKKSGLT
jgi:poly(A) polymerase